jgi:hypothetical protein
MPRGGGDRESRRDSHRLVRGGNVRSDREDAAVSRNTWRAESRSSPIGAARVVSPTLAVMAGLRLRRHIAGAMVGWTGIRRCSLAVPRLVGRPGWQRSWKRRREVGCSFRACSRGLVWGSVALALRLVDERAFSHHGPRRGWAGLVCACRFLPVGGSACLCLRCAPSCLAVAVGLVAA